MKLTAASIIFLFFALAAFAQKKGTAAPLPSQIVIGRHTFFDFGPPNDYYDIFQVTATSDGSIVERISLTPVVDKCFVPAKVEVSSGKLQQSVAALLGKINPCSIPSKELLREQRRCKKCLTFSGQNVVMDVPCGETHRLIRMDILDRDMFDPAANTPANTSWTMSLLEKVESAVGSGVMDKPMFATVTQPTSPSAEHLEPPPELGAGQFDDLFPRAPDKPSELYRQSLIAPHAPSVKLLSSTPFAPDNFGEPKYPPIARVAHVEGVVSFEIDVAPNGAAINFRRTAGAPLLAGGAQKLSEKWQFPKSAAGQTVQASIEFKTNCPKSETPKP
ncbi:MAG TPA: energy transducer TonB [Candidatus Acidoferrales bacterium]